MSLDDDAREFGQHFKQGGWRLGFLVARCCDPSSKGGRPPKDENRSQVNSSGKVSFRQFAEMAGVSPAHVSYCFRAWESAADDDHVPHAENLSPDDDQALDHIEENDEDTRDGWLTYYRKVRDGGEDEQPAEEQNRPHGRTGSGSGKSSTPDTRVNQAVEALSKTSEQLSEKLVKVVNATPLRGDQAELARFAEQVRQTRSVLDGYCREIDLVLKRIGFGDAEAEPATESN